MHIGFPCLAYGISLLESSLPVLDFVQLEPMTSTRSLVRLGFLLFVYGLICPDFMLPISDCATLDPLLSLQSSV
jgi:hypothetical protein